MGDFPLQGTQVFDMEGKTSDTTVGVTVTGGAANTKGAWAPITTSCPVAAVGMLVCLTNKSASTDYLFDVGIGAAAAERVLVPNLFYGGTNSSRVATYFLPVRVPKGARVSLRSQAITASATSSCWITFIAETFRGLPGWGGRCEALGAATADSGGAAITAPGTINVKGAWTQIGGATAHDYSWLIPVIADQAVATRTSGSDLSFDLGIGAAGSQRILLPDLPYTMTSNTLVQNHQHGFPLFVPAGSALWMRYSASALTALGFDGIVYGIT